MKETPQIIVVGSSNTDMVVKTDRIPAPGETVLGGDFMLAAGGKGANQAVAASRLGAHVTFIARIGTDIFGSQSMEKFHDEGIETGWVTRDNSVSSGVALILVDRSGENIIAVASGANAKLSEADVLGARERIESADVLLLQLEVPLETVRKAAELADAAGVKVILNPAPAQPLDSDLLRHITVLTPNETETGILTGIKVDDESACREAARKLRSQGATNVVITRGAQGSFLSSPDGERAIPSRKVEAVDTTAAGDAFNGALAVMLAAGKPLPEAVRLANLAGALAATRMGAQPSLPNRKEFFDFV